MVEVSESVIIGGLERNMSVFLKRTWAEIDLDALIHNFNLCKKVSGREVMAIVKADAYGHGVKYIAKTLESEGVSWFGVSNIEEAVQLRRFGIKGKILILGFTPPEYTEVLVNEAISQTVYSADYGESLSKAALSLGTKVKIHIKLDTGMRRLGFDCIEDTDLSVSHIKKLIASGAFISEGLFTHFASSDRDGDIDGSFTSLQARRFEAAKQKLMAENIYFEVHHLSQTGGVYTRQQEENTLVRPGIMLYGMATDPAIETPDIPVKPILSLKTAVVMLKTLRKGETIGYGRTYKAEADRLIATVPIGYADGYPRVVSNKGCMLVRGKRAPIVGRVCMDQLMLDVTGINGVCEGDIVTAIGNDGGEMISVNELSALSGTISYETLCSIGKRVPRIFYRNGEIAGQTNYVTESF